MIEIKFSGASVDEVVGDLVNFTGAILQKDLGLVRKDPNETNELWTSGAEVELPWEDPETDKPKTNVVIQAKEEPAEEKAAEKPTVETKPEPEPEAEEPAEETETAVSLQDTKKAMVAAVHAGKKDDVKAALKAHGIEKLSLATEEQLPSLYAAFKELT